MSENGGRLPRGRHKLSRQEVVSSQRTRIFDSMAEAVAAAGYAKTSVADVIARAGVSRETFYQQFKSKEDCFLEALDMYSDLIIQVMDQVVSESDSADPVARIDTMLTTYLDLIAGFPAMARVFLIDVYAVGDPGIERRTQVQKRFTDLIVRITKATEADDIFVAEVVVAALSSLTTSAVVTAQPDEIRALHDPVMVMLRRLTAQRDTAEESG